MSLMAKLPDHAILTPWSTAERGDEYTKVVREVFDQFGLRITSAEAREDIDRRLFALNLLPVRRKALKADYQKAQRKCRRLAEADV